MTDLLWQKPGVRIDARLQAFLAGEDVVLDREFFEFDIRASVAHAEGLQRIGLLTGEELGGLKRELAALADDFKRGVFVLDARHEDGHSAIEARLTERLGDAGRKIHTGRSRNDQVATCLVLHARQGLADVAVQAHRVAVALTAQAAAHAETPWVARTHGQPAQPATLGFLLAAHAFRFHALTSRLLQAFDAVGTSPLGSGAVAGSTLPLDPAFTARLLGLAPPQNALLATGGRDASLRTIQACGDVGLLTASLAQDLLDLFTAGHLDLPTGYTTGSSLMPQKRNPDALELVRGHGKALAGAPAAAVQLVSGLGLGYMRDLQAIKPLQAQATMDAAATLAILADCIEGGTFHIPADVLGAPGITATDAVEALVAHGVPFRTAYEALAAAHHAVEEGEDLAMALQAQPLPVKALQAALAALKPDPTRRDTLGGPAPVQVRAQTTTLDGLLTTQAKRLGAAQEAVQTTARLLETPAKELLA